VQLATLLTAHEVRYSMRPVKWAKPGSGGWIVISQPRLKSERQTQGDANYPFVKCLHNVSRPRRSRHSCVGLTTEQCVLRPPLWRRTRQTLLNSYKNCSLYKC